MQPETPYSRIGASARNRTGLSGLQNRCIAANASEAKSRLSLGLPAILLRSSCHAKCMKPLGRHFEAALLRWTDGDLNPDLLDANQACSRCHYQPLVARYRDGSELPVNVSTPAVRSQTFCDTFLVAPAGLEPAHAACRTATLPLGDGAVGRAGFEPA